MHPSPTLLQTLTLTLTLTLITSTVNSSGDERASLLQLRDTLLSPSINLHSNWTGPACYQGRSRWFGISCSPQSHVISIDLHSTQLTGSLSSSSFQNITYLSTIILANNSLNGTLPTLEGLHYLQSLSLAGNRFSGSIPKEYIDLKSLIKLELQHNLLNGSVPALDQPSLQVFNVSYNFLQGLIPEALKRFDSSCFDHNLGLCGKPLDVLCPLPPSPSPSPSTLPTLAGKSSLETWVLVCVAVGAVLVPLFVILCFFCVHRWCLKRKKKEAEEQEKAKFSSGEQEEKELRYGKRGVTRTKNIAELEFMDKEKQSMTFDLDDLLRASAEVMGRGQLGTTYKTTLESGSIVAVKRLIREINGGLSRKEFVQHMQLLAQLKHENVAEIIAFYFSMDEKLLIFDHVPHGSLFQLLHENRGEGRVPLKWETRLNIVKGIARGLAYLHQSLPSSSFKVPHGNLKTSNVLILHPNHHPKLTDYAFLPLLQTLNLTLIDKLAISKTPEYHKTKRNKMKKKKKMMMMLSSKADVFCFGLILIEVITGLIIPSDEAVHDHGGGDLSEWVRSVVTNEWSTDILDLEIVGEDGKHEEMMKLVDIALECTCFDPEKRPFVHDLLCRIEDIST